jgi:hypothetical protein
MAEACIGDARRSKIKPPGLWGTCPGRVIHFDETRVAPSSPIQSSGGSLTWLGRHGRSGRPLVMDYRDQKPGTATSLEHKP